MSKEIRCFPHLSALCSPLWYRPPTLSMLHPTSNPTELEGGLLMDVEGCSGPTAINSSPARSGLSGWWNLPTTAACHTVQEGLQTNASSMCLLYRFAYGRELAQAKSYEVHRKPSTFLLPLHLKPMCGECSGSIWLPCITQVSDTHQWWWLRRGSLKRIMMKTL